MGDPRVALVHPVPFGEGGLGIQTANAAAALTRVGALHAIGPAPRFWPRSDPAPRLHQHAVAVQTSWMRAAIARVRPGRAQCAHEIALGTRASHALEPIAPSICYAFTQVALDALRWSRRRGIPTVLESPNGHLRAFRQVYVDEHARWCGGAYHGTPTNEMIDRVEEEYELADRIRVSSEWAKASLAAGGVSAAKVTVLQQPVDLVRYHPAPPPAPDGPLRLVFVGTLDLRKGFVYLLEAVRRMQGRVALEIVGGTVSRCTRRLLADGIAGLDVRAAAGDPRDAYHRAEVSVLPTLEDGSPFAVAESMAAGLPVITTTACGAREWVRHGSTGWLVPPRDVGAIVEALTEALDRRRELAEMGRAARLATERRADAAICDAAVAAWAAGAIDPA